MSDQVSNQTLNQAPPAQAEKPLKSNQPKALVIENNEKKPAKVLEVKAGDELPSSKKGLLIIALLAAVFVMFLAALTAWVSN